MRLRKIPVGERPARRRLWSDRAGNIALITAMCLIPLTFALGMAFDFTLAQSRQDKLDGIADAAALGGVTPTEMAQSWDAASTQSKALFNGQAATVGGVTSVSVTTPSPGDVVAGTTVTRTITVSYTAQSQNVFAALLGMPTMTIQGSSTAKASTAPNIDFYLMLDTSPSMEIAATSAGMTTLEGDTGLTREGTCAFGCHFSNAAYEAGPGTSCASHPDPGNSNIATTQCQYLTAGNQKIHCTTGGAYADGTSFTSASIFPESGRDHYDLTRCLGITLRIDLLNTATQNLMTSAAAAEVTYKSTYRMALYLTDSNQSDPSTDLSVYPLEGLTPNLSDAKTKAATIGSLEMYQNNWLVSSDGGANQDMDTYLDAALTSMGAKMPPPGTGTNNAGDTPQEVLFIVTDGLSDVGSPRNYPPMDWSGANCAAIKARGIRIAVLYTTYVPFPGWFETNVQPSLPTGLPPKLPSTTPVGNDPMALAAQQCASQGLYYEVNTDGDISAALQALFEKVITTARLTH